MSQPELLKTVIRVLEEAGIGDRLTGSVVASLQGEPRLSHDIDVVVAIEPSSIPRQMKAFLLPTIISTKNACGRRFNPERGST